MCHTKFTHEVVCFFFGFNIEFFIDEIVVEEGFAYATTGSKGTAIIQATGEKIPEENRELFVFEKVGGEWKIARYMFNKTK